jgi:Nucleoside permease
MSLLQLQAAFGLAAFVMIACLLSERRSLRLVPIGIVGVVSQLAIAGLFIGLPVMKDMMGYLGDGVLAIQDATRAGTSFVFGYLGGGPVPFEVNDPNGLMILAFQALPIVLVVSAITTLLTHLGIMARIVAGFSFLLRRVFGLGGAVGLAAAANIFLGMMEAPLFVRNYISKMTRSELFVVMTTGMATIAGTVLAIYASMLEGVIEGAAGHLITASVMSAPAAISLALIMVPSHDEQTTAGDFHPTPQTSSVMDAIAQGTQAGLQLFLGIVAMLIVLISLVALVNMALMALPFFDHPLTLEQILGWAMMPLCWLMGIPWSEAMVAGELMGIKTMLNEFLAYSDLANKGPEQISDRTRLIMTYALCGFANFGSLGILLGGLIAMAPDRHHDLMTLGPKSLISGTMATMMTGAIISLITPS